MQNREMGLRGVQTHALIGAPRRHRHITSYGGWAQQPRWKLAQDSGSIVTC
jgi:hypothetical protein